MKLKTLALAVLLLALPAQALAQAYSFPYAGVSLQTEEDWTLLTPDTLDERAEWLQSLGASVETVRADYAAAGTVWEVYLPDGAQVSLSVAQTEQTEAWDSMAFMTESEKEDFFLQYRHAPYENLTWPEALPGYLRCDWTLQSGDTAVSFARLMTIRQGALYALTATGVGLPLEALHAACQTVLEAMEYLGARAGQRIAEDVATPEPIADDGVVTPVALVDFVGITESDSTEIVIQTLPGTELTLLTASDSLRGTADETGLHSYTVSTRRESVYRYTLVARAPEREESRLEIAVERRLTGDALREAYQSSARAVSFYGYDSLTANAQGYAGEPVTFRGRVAAFSQTGGFPCALVYTANPGTGVWREPVWVVLMEAVLLEEDAILTFYGDVRGDTLPYQSEEGETEQAPAVVCRYVEP